MGVDWIWLYDIVRVQDVVGGHMGVDLIGLSDVAGAQDDKMWLVVRYED